MEIKEIVAVLEELARSSEDAAVSDPRHEEHFSHTAKALREAIARVETYPPAREETAGLGTPLTWAELLTRVGRTVFVEFNDRHTPMPNGEVTVARVSPNATGVVFAQNGRIVRVVLDSEYGDKCWAYAVCPGEELP